MGIENKWQTQREQLNMKCKNKVDSKHKGLSFHCEFGFYEMKAFLETTKIYSLLFIEELL